MQSKWHTVTVILPSLRDVYKRQLQNGAKFYLGNTNGFIKVDQTYKVNGTAVSTYNATGDLAIENATCLLYTSELDELLESLHLSFGMDITKYKLDKE